MRQLIDEVRTIPDDAIPLSPASKAKLASLKTNIPIGWLTRFHERGKIVLKIHQHIDKENLTDLKEAIADWSSYSEEI